MVDLKGILKDLYFIALKSDAYTNNSATEFVNSLNVFYSKVNELIDRDSDNNGSEKKTDTTKNIK